MKKKIIICGDSWMAPLRHPCPLHFSSILGELIDCDVVAFSRVGSSNKSICLQIESAIAQKPDLIIFNTTDAGRTEVFTHCVPTEITAANLVHQYGDDIKNELGYYEPYIISAGIVDLLENDWAPHKNVLISVYPDFAKNIDGLIADKKEALKYYLMELFNENFAIKIDTWCYAGILSNLEYSQIPYLIILDNINIRPRMPWLQDKNIALPYDYWNKLVNKNIKKWEQKHKQKAEVPSWHTLPSDQYVMANIIHEHLKNNNLI